MAGTFELSGSNLKVIFTYNGPAAVITDIAVKAAHNLYDRGLGDFGDTNGDRIPFDSLTNAQKLSILDGYIASVCMNLAKDYHVAAAVAATTTTASAEALALTI
jgi:hypothetical protein